MFTLNCKGRLFRFTEPIVMGIINATPDSFYTGSRISAVDAAVEKAAGMIADGAMILDLGGQSTRPNSEKVSASEEASRVVPLIEAIHKAFPEQLISIDTFYGSVAKDAVAAGASILNDVSAGSLDPSLLPTVASLKLPYILMHMRGTPQTMQQHTDYTSLVIEIFDHLSFKIKELTELGIVDIMVDPGFGFSKTIEQNFELLRQLSFFTKLGKPLLVGLSRKATVYKTLGITAGEALNGSTVLHTAALLNGVSILRVHDVKEAREAIVLVEALKEKEQ